MKLLLDTHVWLWWYTDPQRLSAQARRQIADPDNDVFLSTASVWEMAIKRQLGKLPLPEPIATYVATRLERDGMKPLLVSIGHAAGVETLEALHRDPVDRLLIVQARQEQLRLFTVDDNVLAYGPPTFDARG